MLLRSKPENKPHLVDNGYVEVFVKQKNVGLISNMPAVQKMLVVVIGNLR